MALSPTDLIEDAKALAFPYLSEYHYTPVSLLRQLSTLDGEVVDWFVATAPERLSTAGADLTVTLAANLAGYTLTSARAYVYFRYMTSEGIIFEDPIEIVPESRFGHPATHPSGIVRGSTFFPADPFEKNWADGDTRPYFKADGDKILYRYVPLVTRITTLTQTLISPDEARDYLTHALLGVILLMAERVPPERLQAVFARTFELKQMLLLSASKRTTTVGRFGV